MRVKAVLRKDQKADGTYPLAIKIFADGKASYMFLEYSIRKDQWDGHRVKASHPNHKRLNNFLLKKIAEATDISLQLETEKGRVSTEAVRQKIKPAGGVSFFGQAQHYLDILKASGKYNQYTADKPRIKHFKEFLQGRDIAFPDITVGTLENFKAYLLSSGDHGERSAVNHLVVIRSVFSQAIKNGINDPKHYPFGKGKMKIKFPESVKIGPTAEEITKLENAALPPVENHARNAWLLSFYLAGMRVSDLFRLTMTDIQDGRLHYTMGKNKKAGSFKIHERALKILEQYKEHKHNLVLPELQRLDTLDDDFIVQRTIAFSASRIDKILRNKIAPAVGITKTLTMHVARHSFAQIAEDKISPKVLQKLYRHSKLETTMGYQQNFIHKQTDDAIDHVLNF